MGQPHLKQLIQIMWIELVVSSTTCYLMQCVGTVHDAVQSCHAHAIHAVLPCSLCVYCAVVQVV